MRSITAAADKTDKIAITLPRSILQKIEKVRGDIPRSTYIRRALQNYLKQGKTRWMTAPDVPPLGSTVGGGFLASGRDSRICAQKSNEDRSRNRRLFIAVSWISANYQRRLGNAPDGITKCNYIIRSSHIYRIILALIIQEQQRIWHHQILVFH